MNRSWADPSLSCQASAASEDGAAPSIHPAGEALGVPMGWGKDTPWCLHPPVLISWGAAWSWGQCCMLCAPQFAVTGVAGPASPCQPLCSPASWPGPPLLDVSPEPHPDPNGHISGRSSCACVCWDPGCPAPAAVPVPGPSCPPHGLAPPGTPRAATLGHNGAGEGCAVPGVRGRPCWANVAASHLGAGLGLAPPSPGPSLPGKILPDSVPSSPGGSPESPQPVPVPGASVWWGHAEGALGTALGAGTREQYPPCEPCPAAMPPPCPQRPKLCDGGSPGPGKLSPWTFPIASQPRGPFRAPRQPTTCQ